MWLTCLFHQVPIYSLLLLFIENDIVFTFGNIKMYKICYDRTMYMIDSNMAYGEISHEGGKK